MPSDADAFLRKEEQRTRIETLRQNRRLQQVLFWVSVSWISCAMIFIGALTIAVGRGWLDFTNYQWFISIVVVQFFGQILGMGYIVVRYLFPRPV